MRSRWWWRGRELTGLPLGGGPYNTGAHVIETSGLAEGYEPPSADLRIPKGSIMSEQIPQPSVGRIVHYVSFGTPGGEYASKCRAAIIAEVVEGALPPMFEGGPVRELDSAAVVVDLVVFNPKGVFFDRCPQNEVDHAGGTWHWPERT